MLYNYLHTYTNYNNFYFCGAYSFYTYQAYNSSWLRLHYKMARRGGEGAASGGPMNTIIGGFVGLLVKCVSTTVLYVREIVAIVILGPTLAGSIEGAVPAMSPTSDWNSTHNTDLPTGAEMWTQNVTIGSIVILVFFIALAIWSEFGIGAKFKGFTSSIQTSRLHTRNCLIWAPILNRAPGIASMYPFGGEAMRNQATAVVVLG